MGLTHELRGDNLPIFGDTRDVTLYSSGTGACARLLNIIPRPGAVTTPLSCFGDSCTPFIRTTIGRLKLPLIFGGYFNSFNRRIFLYHDGSRILLRVKARPFVLRRFVTRSTNESIHVRIINNRVITTARQVGRGSFETGIAGNNAVQRCSPGTTRHGVTLSTYGTLKLAFNKISVLRNKVLYRMGDGTRVVGVVGYANISVTPLVFRRVGDQL